MGSEMNDLLHVQVDGTGHKAGHVPLVHVERGSPDHGLWIEGGGVEEPVGAKSTGALLPGGFSVNFLAPNLFRDTARGFRHWSVRFCGSIQLWKAMQILLVQKFSKGGGYLNNK